MSKENVLLDKSLTNDVEKRGASFLSVNNKMPLLRQLKMKSLE